MNDKPIVRYRCAITGKFVSAAYATANPDTTIEQTMRRPCPKPSDDGE